MNFSIGMFFQKWWDVIGAVFLILAILFFSISTLTTKPELWTDEAISIHIARSFLNQGTLSIQTAPHSFFESPHLIQATGYPVTVPLAGFFKLFGYGFSEARAFMLLWITAALLLVFFLARALFSKFEAVSALLLTTTFASFYANGRVVTGEIPGFVFLLLGFLFLFLRGHYFVAGLFWGLSVVAKPSVFTAIIPTIFLALLFERLSYREFFKQLFAFACGMIPAGLLWVLLVLEKPFEGEMWREIISFYKNPYGEDITQNIIRNLSGFFDSTTLIYFTGLFVFVLFAWVLSLREKNKLTFLYSFIIMYTLFAFFYYIRSSGYLRYVLIAELLILFVFPHAISVFLSWAKSYFKTERPTIQTVVASVVGALVLIQGVHLFTAADISSGDEAIKVGEYVRSQFSEQTIGFLNTPMPAIFTDPLKTFLSVYLLGLEPIGENPLLFKELPNIIVSYSSNQFIDEEKEILEKHYAPREMVGGYIIFKRNLIQ